MWQVKVSHKSERAGPFNRGDTIINKHFTFYFLLLLNNLSKRDQMRDLLSTLSLFAMNLINSIIQAHV